jgi:glycosyltransferase involved in cell wall biosynthesis
MKPSGRSCIVFLTAHKATNVLNWSGTLNSLLRSLEARSPTRVVALDGAWLSSLARQVNRVLFFFGTTFDCQLTTLYSFLAGVFTSARLAFLPNGPIVAVAASNYVPFLLTRRPIVYISDATFTAAAKLYPVMMSLPRWLFKQCDHHEAITLRRATFVILPSRWAADSAISDYGINPEKIFVLPFGANMSKEVVDANYVPKRMDGKAVQLLFASADWSRKGGDKAIEVCRALQSLGVDARLTVIGRAPERIRALKFIEFKGFLRKDDPKELSEICSAFRRAHFFLLPTQADASPIVFAEAQAFGVPPITHNVGGTASSIKHGATGLLFPLDASPAEFAEGILPYVRDPAMYKELSRNCRAWYLDSAQWSHWSDLVFRLCRLNS